MLYILFILYTFLIIDRKQITLHYIYKYEKIIIKLKKKSQ